MMRSCKLLLFGMLVVLFTGCASDGTLTNPFETTDASTSGYFQSEFEGIPIPNGMTESRNDTFITFTPSGIKCGTQRFTGRVEAVSLMNATRRYMAEYGWTLRSLLRAKESTLIFEKPDRIALFHITDGMVNTEMRIVVSPRLEGDSPSVGAATYTPAPAGSGSQPLSQ